MSQSLSDLTQTCGCGERFSMPMPGLTTGAVFTCSSCKFEHRLTAEQIEQIDKVFVVHMR